MRVAINCRSFLKKERTGIGRHTYNLVKFLGEIDQENEYCLYAPKRIFDFKRVIPRFDAKNIFAKYDYFKRGLDRTIGAVDIYHSPSPDFLPQTKAKIVVTVHDLIYKTYTQGHTDETCRILDEQMETIVNLADKILCCSQSTIDDLKEFFDVDEDKIRLIYPGVDKNIFYSFDEEKLKESFSLIRKKGIEEPFILFVGTIEPRKNLENLLDAFILLKKRGQFSGKLVIIGMRGWMMDDLEKKIKSLNLKNDCIFLGYVKDRELAAFYNCAQVFVFPSFYEGFGFPIIEALSCGAATVVSSVSSCGEVAGDASLLIDPGNADDIACAIARVINDKTLKDKLRIKAVERAKVFSFRNTAEQTLEVYQQIYDSMNAYETSL
jgi:glycosyltransferase involved in cell wall biosynthesis